MRPPGSSTAGRRSSGSPPDSLRGRRFPGEELIPSRRRSTIDRKGGSPMRHVAFAGTFAASVEPRVRQLLRLPCQVTVIDEAGVIATLPEIDVLVTMVFTAEMAGAARR